MWKIDLRKNLNMTLCDSLLNEIPPRAVIFTLDLIAFKRDRVECRIKSRVIKKLGAVNVRLVGPRERTAMIEFVLPLSVCVGTGR